jgi:hypothetical protein
LLQRLSVRFFLCSFFPAQTIANAKPTPVPLPKRLSLSLQFAQGRSPRATRVIESASHSGPGAPAGGDARGVLKVRVGSDPARSARSSRGRGGCEGR